MDKKQSFNVYCDESCHLENDNQKYMVLGGIKSSKVNRTRIVNEINNIKEKYNISVFTEIKWNKVSNSKLEYYKELVKYFFENNDLMFRAIVIDKSQINHKKYNQTHDEWYYKMYYQLLLNLVEPKQENNIYLDIKDTKSEKKIRELSKFLKLKLIDYEVETIKKIQSINSQESVILQLADLLIGAIGYKNRKVYVEDCASLAKTELMDYITTLSGYSLTKNTLQSEKKFNIFCIDLSGGKSSV